MWVCLCMFVRKYIGWNVCLICMLDGVLKYVGAECVLCMFEIVSVCWGMYTYIRVHEVRVYIICVWDACVCVCLSEWVGVGGFVCGSGEIFVCKCVCRGIFLLVFFRCALASIHVVCTRVKK